MSNVFVKLDANYLDNEKMLQVSETAELLYLRMLTVSKRLLSDGRIVSGHLYRYGPMGPSGSPDGAFDAAHELVQVGLWEKEGEGAWLIAGWMERNASSEEVDQTQDEGRKNALKRWHRAGKHETESHPLCPECPPTGGSTGGPMGEGNEGPLPETEVETEKESGGNKPKKPSRATQLPKDWEPNSGHADLARELGVDLEREVTQFRDYAVANGKTYKDWNAGFRTWLRNAQKFGRSKSTAPGGPDGVTL